MDKKQTYISVIYTLADGQKIQIDNVTKDVARALNETDDKLLALLKQDKRHIDKWIRLDILEENVYCAESVEDMIEKLESYAKVHSALEKLTKIQCRRIKARFFEELSYAEIAEREKISEAAVRASINKALKKLLKFFI